MRHHAWPAAAALSACLLVGTRLEPPLDVGTWHTGALPGEVVLALAREPDEGSVVVGTRRGLHRLHPDGRTSGLGAVGPVHALAATTKGTWVGTDDGLLRLVDEHLTPGPDDLPRDAVHALDADGERLLLGSDAGVHEVVGGVVTRLWPPPGRQPVPVSAVLATSAGILLAHPEGLALLGGDGEADVVVPGVDVLTLGRLGSNESVWAGTRGAPLLVRSDDGGRTWSPHGEGLGFSALNALATDPTRLGHHVAGGSGLADGTGNAGTQWTVDDMLTWQVAQDRLSNTHVFAMTAGEEPVRVSLGLVGTDRSASVPLPVTTPRWYAGTNGSGVATMRPEVPALDTLASAAPWLRIAEPVLLGLLLLGVLLPAYRRLARNRATMRAPPSPAAPTTHRPPARDTTTNQEQSHAHDQDTATAAGEPHALRGAHADRLRRWFRERERGRRRWQRWR